MENREDFHHDDLLERAVDAVLRDPIPGELPPDQVAQLVAAVRQAADKPCPITLIERIENMKLRTRIAVAAAVLIAFIGLMSWLVPGSGTALAFGDVAEALNSVHSATWRTTTVVKGPKNESVTWSGTGMFLAPSHERIEMIARGKKSIQIYDGKKDKAIALDPAAKTATVINLKNLPSESPYGRTFQGLRELVAGPKKAGPSKSSGWVLRKSTAAVPRAFISNWAPWKSRSGPIRKRLLPIRVEETTGAASGSEVRIVMSDFQIGVDLDESLFSVDVPAGYTVQQTMQIDLSKKPVAYLAEALKWAAEHNDGVFPATMRGEQGMDGVMRRAGTEMAKNLAKNDPEMMKLQTDIAMKLGGAFGVLFALPPDAWHYAGKDVKLNTPNRPIFWYKLKTDAKCTVIYADLSIKEVPPEETPKAPPPESDSKP